MKQRTEVLKEETSRATDQRIRLQTQIRVDGEELLKFVQDKNEAPAKVSFLFGLLNATVQADSDSGDDSIAAEYARPLTDSLVGLITEDSGFEKSPRNVVFASKALDNWDDYKRYLSENPQLLSEVLYEHTRAIRYLRDTNPGYLQSLFYNKESGDIDHPEFENVKGEEVRYQQFVDVWESFKDHIKFAEELIQTAKADGKDVSQAKLEKNIAEFEGALCNAKIAPHILKGHFTGVRCEIGNRSK